MASGRSWQIKRYCDIIRHYPEGIESSIYENDREATVGFPVIFIFIMLLCHMATEVGLLRDAYCIRVKYQLPSILRALMAKAVERSLDSSSEWPKETRNLTTLWSGSVKV